MRLFPLKQLTMACALAVTAAVPAVAANVTVTGAWFRTLPGGLPAAGYFTLKNADAKPIALIGASAAGCGQLQLHMTHDMGGMKHMMEVTKIDIPAGGSFVFATGGYHLMCMEPKLTTASTVPVTLRFSDGSSVTASFDVRAAGKR